jgi:hypothetical protein
MCKKVRANDMYGGQVSVTGRVRQIYTRPNLLYTNTHTHARVCVSAATVTPALIHAHTHVLILTNDRPCSVRADTCARAQGFLSSTGGQMVKDTHTHPNVQDHMFTECTIGVVVARMICNDMCYSGQGHERIRHYSTITLVSVHTHTAHVHM